MYSLVCAALRLIQGAACARLASACMQEVHVGTHFKINYEVILKFTYYASIMLPALIDQKLCLQNVPVPNDSLVPRPVFFAMQWKRGSTICWTGSWNLDSRLNFVHFALCDGSWLAVGTFEQ